MKFDTQEEFDAYLEEVETDAADYAQNLSDQGLDQQTKPLFGNTTAKDAVSPNVQAFIDSKKDDKTAAPLGGKQI